VRTAVRNSGRNLNSPATHISEEPGLPVSYVMRLEVFFPYRYVTVTLLLKLKNFL
jgi:hypothetical protein